MDFDGIMPGFQAKKIPIGEIGLYKIIVADECLLPNQLFDMYCKDHHHVTLPFCSVC